MDKNEPVDLVVVEPTKIDGKHVEIGTKLNKVPTELAFELTGAGKTRLWTEELEAEMKERAKSEKAAAKKRADAQSGGVVANAVSEFTPGITADQLAETVKAAIQEGIQAGIALAAAAIPEAPAEETPAA